MSTSVSRRQFLKGAGLAGASLALAACVAPGMPAAVEPGAQPIHLVLWGWWEPRMAIYDNVAQEWPSSGTTTPSRFSPSSGRLEKIYSAIEAGPIPICSRWARSSSRCAVKGSS